MSPLRSILFVSIAALAQVFSLDGSYSILTSTSTGLAVGMNLYLPPGYNPLNAKRYPLMVFLGGAGERGDPTNAAVVLQKSTVWGPSKEIRYANRDFPFIVVTPISTKWYSSLPFEYGTMVEYLKSTRRVDPDRVYFTGACAGASGVMEFAQVHHQKLAAIVPALTQTPTPWSPARLQEMPTWLFHSFADPYVSRQQTITWANAIANSFAYPPQSCMDTYPYGTTPSGGQTYNPNNQTGSFRPGRGWSWTKYTRSADDSLLLFTMMSTDLHNVWHYAVTNNTVLHWMTKQRRQSPFDGTPAALPGRVQAEAFDFGGHLRAYRDSTIANTGGSSFRDTLNPYDGTVDHEQVDVAAGGTGMVLSGTVAGEWLEYTVDCQSGTYALELRISASVSGGALHLESGGVRLTPSIAIPVTAGYTTQVVQGVSLSAGRKTVRLVIEGGGFNLDWFALTSSSSGLTDLIIDNNDVGRVTIVGAWSATTSAVGFYSANYLSTAPASSKRVVYRPNVPRSGTYTISVWYPATPSRGKSPVTIAYGDGDMSEVITVDQRVNGGTWNLLGTFPLDAGSGPTITIGCFDSGGWIGADAVRLVESPIGGPG